MLESSRFLLMQTVDFEPPERSIGRLKEMKLLSAGPLHSTTLACPTIPLIECLSRARNSHRSFGHPLTSLPVSPPSIQHP